jgi:hypothetical protein
LICSNVPHNDREHTLDLEKDLWEGAIANLGDRDAWVAQVEATTTPAELGSLIVVLQSSIQRKYEGGFFCFINFFGFLLHCMNWQVSQVDRLDARHVLFQRRESRRRA